MTKSIDSKYCSYCAKTTQHDVNKEGGRPTSYTCKICKRVKYTTQEIRQIMKDSC